MVRALITWMLFWWDRKCWPMIDIPRKGKILGAEFCIVEELKDWNRTTKGCWYLLLLPGDDLCPQWLKQSDAG